MPSTTPSRRCLAFLTVALLSLPLFAVAPPAAALTFNGVSSASIAGVWKTDKGDTFEITQASGGSSFESTVINDTCTGGPRDWVLKGTVSNSSIVGTLEKCSGANDTLVTKCGLSTIWEANMTADFTFDEIVGDYEGEHWTWDTGPNGTYLNCTLTGYPHSSFAFTRVDCPLLSFAALGERFISDPTKRAAEVALANRAESGDKVLWTQAQLAPGGFKENVDKFIAALAAYGYSATVVSAYRPLLYQAHFANMRRCEAEMLHDAIEHPDVAPAVATPVGQVNQHIVDHGIVNKQVDASGLTFRILNVCQAEPYTVCGHTDERAVDLDISTGTVDWIGAVWGFCRPYVYTDPPDPVHWEYFGADPWAAPKCTALGTGPGEADIQIEGDSPVNLLLKDSSGHRIGFDPASGKAVNDFGASRAYYSGAGTHPQIITLAASATRAGAYNLSGVGTGEGNYRLTMDLVGLDGGRIDSKNVTGHATSGAQITGLSYTLPADSAPASPWTAATGTAGASGGTHFEVATGGAGNATVPVEVSNSAVSDLLYANQTPAIAINGRGAAGPMTVTLPETLFTGDLTVRADGVQLPVTRGRSGASTTLTFVVPQGAQVITIQGAAGAGPGNTTSLPPSDSSWIVVGVAAVVVVAAAAFLYRRNRRAPRPPPPTP